jgi:hypothetical protein
MYQEMSGFLGGGKFIQILPTLNLEHLSRVWDRTIDSIVIFCENSKLGVLKPNGPIFLLDLVVYILYIFKSLQPGSVSVNVWFFVVLWGRRSEVNRNPSPHGTQQSLDEKPCRAKLESQTQSVHLKLQYVHSCPDSSTTCSFIMWKQIKFFVLWEQYLLSLCQPAHMCN